MFLINQILLKIENKIKDFQKAKEEKRKQKKKKRKRKEKRGKRKIEKRKEKKGKRKKLLQASANVFIQKIGFEFSLLK